MTAPNGPRAYARSGRLALRNECARRRVNGPGTGRILVGGPDVPDDSPAPAALRNEAVA